MSDDTTGKTPNPNYGYGRLDAAGALGVESTGATPTISLAMEPADPTTKDTVTLTPTATSGDASSTGLQIKWDDGYDGTWDVPYGPVAPRKITSSTPAKIPFKARVRNAAGHIAEAVVWVTFSAPPPAPPVMPGKTSSGCGCRDAGEAPGTGAWAVLGAVALLGARRRRSARTR